MTREVLDLVLPSGGGIPGELDRARLAAAVQVARLLAGLGGGPRAASVDLDLARATADLRRQLGAEALARVRALFGAHLAGAGPDDLVPWTGGAAGPGAWEGLADLARRVPELALPSLPAPAEPPAAVARRLLHGAERLGLGPAGVELWRAHLERAEGEPGAAEARLVALAEDPDVDHATRTAAVTALAGSLLERGAPGRARDLVTAHLDLCAADRELARRAAWACALAGEPDLAEELAVPTPAAALPSLLAAAGRRRPELRRLLCGGAAWDLADVDEGDGDSPRTFARGRRDEVGAAVLAVFALDGDRALARHLDLAPGLVRAGRDHDAWLADRALAPWDPAELEAEALAAGRPRVAFPGDDDAAARRLARSCRTPACLAVAVVPILGPGGRRAGWLRLELEHLLVPTDADLATLAGALGRRLGLGVGTADAPPREVGPDPAHLAGLLEPLLGSDAHRRWWLVDGDDRVLAAGGQALAGRAAGGGGLLRSARSHGVGACLAGGGDPEATRHERARSALVLPVGPGRSPATPWLVVEGTRTRDLGPRRLTQLTRRLDGGTRDRVLLAAFAAACRETLGIDLHLDPAPLLPGRTPGDPGPLGTGELLDRLADAPPSVVVLAGPPGSGRRTAAALVAWLATGDPRPAPVLLPARGPEGGLGQLAGGAVAGATGPDDLSAPAHLATSGPRLVEGLGTLAGRADLRALVARAMAPAAEPCAPLVLVLDTGGAAGAGDEGGARRQLEGVLGQDLARDLGPHVLQLVAGGRRRRERAGMLEVLLRREAARLRRLPPALPPDLTGPLWRLDLDLDRLGVLARRLVDLRPGDELSAGDLALALGQDPPRRLPSKRPDPVALWAALDGTRKAGGSFHRRRAAALLGWDPDTVTARIRDLGWSELG